MSKLPEPIRIGWQTMLVISALAKIKRLADGGFVTPVVESILESNGQSISTSEPLDLSKMKSIAVIRLDEIGDVVLTSPMLRELRRNLPGADITLIVKSGIRPLVENCPYVNRVIGVEMGGSGGWAELRRMSVAWRESKKRLWDLKFDLAILPRCDLDLNGARMLAMLSGARYRVGFADPAGGFDGHAFAPLTSERFLTHVVHGAPLLHEALRPLELLKEIGGTVERDSLEIWIDENDRQSATQLLKDAGPPRVAVGIAALQEVKRWPVKNFAQVAKQLREKYRASIVLIGGPMDRALADEMLGQLDFSAVDLIGKTTLRQTAAVLEQCDLYVGNDTGPLHLAAAAGTPAVVIASHPIGGDPTGRYSPERFGPRGVPNRIVRPKPVSPCTTHCQSGLAHCILNVQVEDVERAIEGIWPEIRQSS